MYVITIIYYFKQQDAERWTPVIVAGGLSESFEDRTIIAASDSRLVRLTYKNAVEVLEGRLVVLKDTRKEVEEPAKVLGLDSEAGRMYARGRGLLAARDYAGALAAFDKSLALDPDQAAVYIQKGIALKALNRPKEALAAIDAGIAKSRQALKRSGAGESGLWWPYLHRGHSLLLLARLDEAIAAFSDAIRLNPKSQEAYGYRALAYLERSEVSSFLHMEQEMTSDLRQARQDLEQAVKLGASNAATWRLKGLVHFALREDDAGCAAARRACELGDCRLAQESPQCKR